MTFEKLSELIIYMQRGISPKYSDNGIPVINQKCIRNGQLTFEDVKFHSPEKTYSPEKLLKRDDILINSTGVGTLGRVARVSQIHQLTLADSHVTIVRPDIDKVEPVYLYYVLRLNEPKLVEMSAGSTGQTELSRHALGELKIPLLGRSTQEFIGKTLDYLDKKIILNKALSKTLEDIAQTIFKSWFIDFDPVKAKMNGEKPIGMDDETAALFPDSFEESELGLIPKGWEIEKISDYGRVVTGKTPSTKKHEYWGDEVPFVTIPDMHNQLLITKTNRGLSLLGVNSQKSQNIPSGSTMVSCIATPGLVVLATQNCQTNQQINSVIPGPSYPSTWLFWHLRSLIPTLIVNSGVGTIFANLNKSDFSNIKSITAPVQLRDAYAKVISPKLNLIAALKKESEYLRVIRDSLLPRLISGELQIPEEMLAS